MGDQIQHQPQLVNLFQEERATNTARQEAINACLNALTKDLAHSKVDSKSTEQTNQIRGWRVKGEWQEGQDQMQDEVPSFLGIQSLIFQG